MSDSEEYDDHEQMKNLLELKSEIEKYKSNPATSGMFVSGWDDAEQDVDTVNNPKEKPEDHALYAAENGEVDTLKMLLSSQPELLHVQDSDGYSLLHRASYGNHIETVAYLLSMGARVDVKTELGWTPLHSACNWNNYGTAARLIAAGADIGALSDGLQTPLHLASAISHCKSTLLVLLSSDDSVNIVNKVNKSGETPEQLARGHGIYGPLFEMAAPEVSYIHSLAFTCNPYVRKSISTES